MRALGLALVAVSVVLVFVALHFVRNQNAAAPLAAVPTGPQIVVATASLNFGDHITAKDLRLVRWPADALPQGAFGSIAAIVGKGGERVALQSIERGEPVLAGKISAIGGRASLSSIIDRGMRAVTLRVNDATGVAGFILPNDRVDVLLTRTPLGQGAGQSGVGREQPQTEILLQNVKVLGVDQEAHEKKVKPAAVVAKVVTLEVTPEDAEKLTLAQQIGTLSLALRNFTSKQVVDIGPFSGANLAPSQPPAKLVEIAAKPASGAKRTALPVTILRGTAEAGK
jgi:pilus assembly protein CpaB